MFGQQEQRGVRRAHSPDTYEADNIRHLPQQHRPNQFHHGQHHGYNQQHFHHNPHHHKRFRADNSFNQPLTIEEKIARLGETGARDSDIGSVVKEIDADLMNKSQDETRIDTLVSKICRCIVSFPTRIGTYSTLIGLISVKHYNISCQIINALHGSYSVYLEAQKWSEALTIIHLLSSLVNCKVIRPSALLSQFEFLLESTIEETAPQARSDYFVYTVLSSLPYVAQELAQEETNEAFEKLLSTIETYLSKRSKEHLNVIRVWKSTDSTIQMDYLDSLWVQMRNFKANGWNETFLHRPYNGKEFRDTLASSLIPTNSPTFQIPGHTAQCYYPSPRIVFRLFEDDVIEGHRAIPGSDKIERFCIENHVRNTIDEMASEPRDCARHLVHIYRADQLPLKHIFVETILGELFALPKPRQDEIFYHTLLYCLNRTFVPAQKNTDEAKYNFDVVVNEAVKILYDNLETMNITCITRFADWFSYHLNSTGFVHPWQTWADAASEDPTSPKVIFVQDILLKLIRFSFHQKIQCLVQEHLSNLMPAEVGVQTKPVFGDHPRAQEFTDTIKKLIVEKADGKTICETLNIIVDGVELPADFVLREEKHSEQLLKIDIFTTVILALASKSLTHLSSAIGKFRNVFKALTKIPNGQIQLLQTVDSCLERHPQLQVILIDKLLKADLIHAPEVCKWIFSDSMKSHYLKPSVWELLNNTIARLVQVVDKLVNEKEDLIYDIKEAEEKAAAAKVKTERDEGRTTPNPDDEISKDDVVMKKELEEVDDSDKAAVETVDEELKRREEAQRANGLLDEKMRIARIALKEFVLQVFSMFSEKLNEHIRTCETSKTSFMDGYFKWIVGRLQEVYYRNNELTRDMYTELKIILDGVPSVGCSIINLNQ